MEGRLMRTRLRMQSERQPVGLHLAVTSGLPWMEIQTLGRTNDAVDTACHPLKAVVVQALQL